MGKEREDWKRALGAAELSESERHRLEAAIARDAGLEVELEYLVGRLSSDLGCSFVRAFIDRLPATEEHPARAVMGALEGVLSNRADGAHG